MDRGERLYQERRRKHQVLQFVKNVWCSGSRSNDAFKDNLLSPSFIGKITSAPHSCSKACCQNPRRWHKGDSRLTLQELKNLDLDNALNV